MGVDEIARRKGKQNFCLILTNVETRQVIAVLKDRTKETFREYIKNLPKEIKKQIKEVSMDMWRPYYNVIEEELPHSKIVIDRFHVMRSLNKELKELKNQEKKKYPHKLKHCHYAILKNEKNLTDKQKEALKTVYETSEILKKAHQLKEQFRNIFEKKHNISEAQIELQNWIEKARNLNLFNSFTNTLNNWLTGILNYFNNRTTNGIVEGINNKIKLIKRRAFGMTNFNNFRLRIIAAFL